MRASNSLSNVQKRFEGLKKVPHYNEVFSGITVGGPLVKNKLFVFGGFDNDIEPSSTVYASGLLTPTATGLSQLAGCYTSADSQASLAALNAYGPVRGDGWKSHAKRRYANVGSRRN